MKVRLTEKQIERLASLLSNNDGRNVVTVLWLDDKRKPEKYLTNTPQKPSIAWDRNNSFYGPWLENNFPKFVWVKTFQEFVEYIKKNGVPDFVSYDHDLGTVENGIDCAAWLKDYCQKNGIQIPKSYVHSANEKRRGGFDEFLTEDAYINGLDKKNKRVNLTYTTQRFKRGQSDFRKGDYVKTDKMDSLGGDTYEVPLKGGITSYNITSINGSLVMKYFKHFFDSQKTTVGVKNSRGNEEMYELEMKKSEYDDFMSQFISKVGSVINYACSEFKSKSSFDQFPEIALYPVPSSSGFNLKMGQELARRIPGVTLIDSGLFKKNLEQLKKDSQFISQNQEYYNKRAIVQGSSDMRTGEMMVDDELLRLQAVNKAQSYVERLRGIGKELIGLWHAREQYKKGGSYEDRLTRLYSDYYNTYAALISASSYTTKRGKAQKAELGKVATLIKYSKPKRVEIRSEDIWNTVGPQLRGKKADNGLPFKQIPVGEWSVVPYQIKNAYDPVRMGLMGYFSKDEEVFRKEAEKIKNSVLVVFDDNVSGGATLSDICYQAKQLGAKFIIPITFGKMSKKFSAGLGKIKLLEPDKRGKYGDPGFETNFEYSEN